MEPIESYEVIYFFEWQKKKDAVEMEKVRELILGGKYDYKCFDDLKPYIKDYIENRNKKVKINYFVQSINVWFYCMAECTEKKQIEKSLWIDRLEDSKQEFTPWTRKFIEKDFYCWSKYRKPNFAQNRKELISQYIKENYSYISTKEEKNIRKRLKTKKMWKNLKKINENTKNPAKKEWDDYIRYSNNSIYKCAMFPFNNSKRIEKLVKEYLNNLDEESKDCLDIYFPKKELKMSGFELKERYKIFNITASQLPCIVIWKKEIKDREIIPIEGLNEVGIFKLLLYIIEYIKTVNNENLNFSEVCNQKRNELKENPENFNDSIKKENKIIWGIIIPIITTIISGLIVWWLSNYWK